MSKHLCAFLGLTLLSLQAAGNTPKFCFQQEVLQKGCLTETPVKDLLVPGRRSLLVAPVKLNQDSYLDLVVQGDGGSGGNQIFVFFQERPGLFVLKGINFGHSVFVEQKPKAPASLIFQSQSGVCQQHFSRLDFELDGYEERAHFNWSCLSETEGLSRYKVEELWGQWNNPRVKMGLEGDYLEVNSVLPAWQLGFVQVDEKFTLILAE